MVVRDSVRRRGWKRAQRAAAGVLMAGLAMLSPVQSALADSCDQYFGEFTSRGDAINVFASAIFVCSDLPGFDAEAIAKFYRETFPGWRPVPVYDGVPEGANLSMLEGRKVLVVGTFSEPTDQLVRCIEDFHLNTKSIRLSLIDATNSLRKIYSEFLKENNIPIPYFLENDKTLIQQHGKFNCDKYWRILLYAFGKSFEGKLLSLPTSSLPLPDLFGLDRSNWR
jgi:hypothetical protein